MAVEGQKKKKTKAGKERLHPLGMLLIMHQPYDLPGRAL
jgi:hypothetical protein